MNTRASGKQLVSPYSDPEKTKKKRNRKTKSSTPIKDEPEVVESSDTTTIEEAFSYKVESDNEEEEPIPTSPHREEMADPNDTPMWTRTRTVAPTPAPAIRRPTIDNNFSVKGNHMKMIQESQFDGRLRSDPHKHIVDFLEICDMFRYGPNMDEAVRLRMFPLSLTGEAKMWYNELEGDSIRTWDQLRETFVGRFFPPALAERLLNDIRAFRQYDRETLVEAWLRMKEMLRNCHGHGLTKENIIYLFYNGLDDHSASTLDAAGGGLFLYMSPNAAYQMLEDKVLLNLDWSRSQKNKQT